MLNIELKCELPGFGDEVKEIVKKVAAIEKEYSCNCTLLIETRQPVDLGLVKNSVNTTGN